MKLAAALAAAALLSNVAPVLIVAAVALGSYLAGYADGRVPRRGPRLELPRRAPGQRWPN
jgi:hypothetical protein